MGDQTNQVLKNLKAVLLAAGTTEQNGTVYNYYKHKMLFNAVLIALFQCCIHAVVTESNWCMRYTDCSCYYIIVSSDQNNCPPL